MSGKNSLLSPSVRGAAAEGMSRTPNLAFKPKPDGKVAPQPSCKQETLTTCGFNYHCALQLCIFSSPLRGSAVFSITLLAAFTAFNFQLPCEKRTKCTEATGLFRQLVAGCKAFLVRNAPLKPGQCLNDHASFQADGCSVGSVEMRAKGAKVSVQFLLGGYVHHKNQSQKWHFGGNWGGQVL